MNARTQAAPVLTDGVALIDHLRCPAPADSERGMGTKITTRQARTADFEPAAKIDMHNSMNSSHLPTRSTRDRVEKGTSSWATAKDNTANMNLAVALGFECSPPRRSLSGGKLGSRGLIVGSGR